jgi:hypothetical protein
MRCAGRRGVRSVIRGRENVIAVTRAVFDGMGWRHPLVIAVKRLPASSSAGLCQISVRHGASNFQTANRSLCRAGDCSDDTGPPHGDRPRLKYSPKTVAMCRGTNSSNPSPSSAESCKPLVPQQQGRRVVADSARAYNGGSNPFPSSGESNLCGAEWRTHRSRAGGRRVLR